MNIMYKTTSSCNANCVYCFDKVSQDNERQLMPINQLVEVFSHLCNLDNNIQWCWHGGEPTLAGIDYLAEAMFQMKRIALRKEVNLCFSMQTNGIALNSDWFDLFDKYDMGLGMSYDGIASLKSRGYISQAEKTQILKQASLLYILNPLNINFLLQDYQRLNKEGNSYCAVNWVFPNDGQTVEQIWANDLETPVKKYLEYVDYYLWDIDGKVKDRNIIGWVLEAIGKKADVCIFGNCWSSSMYCIDYNGYIYKCDELHRKEVKLGKVLDFKSIEELQAHPNILRQKTLREQWIHTDCVNCEFQGNCLQGCYTRALSESQGQHPYSFGCFLTQRVLPHIYNQINDLSPEQFVQLNPIIQQEMIIHKYIPASIKEKYQCL